MSPGADREGAEAGDAEDRSDAVGDDIDQLFA
jgi:hypothetical protein